MTIYNDSVEIKKNLWPKRQNHIFEPPLVSGPQTCRTWSYIIILLRMPQKTRKGYIFFSIPAVKECNMTKLSFL